MRGRAVGIAVLQSVARAVDAGPLAVPETEHALDLAIGLRLDLLRSEHRGRGEILVHRRQKLDPLGLQAILDAPEFEVDAAERRAAIAGDEAGGIKSGGPIAFGLI